MVGVCSVSLSHVIHKLHEHLLRNLSLAHVNSLYGLSVGCGSWDSAHDALSIEEFPPKDDD